jgi:hypothetical protein
LPKIAGTHCKQITQIDKKRHYLPVHDNRKIKKRHAPAKVQLLSAAALAGFRDDRHNQHAYGMREYTRGSYGIQLACFYRELPGRS